MPSPSPRCTETNSRPSESISTLSSVWVPSKSRTTASMSSWVGGRRAGSASKSGARALGAGEVVRVVDLQDPRGVGADEFRAAEEAVLVLAQAGRVHGVGGAGLQQVLRAVLAAGAEGLVVVDAVAAGRGSGGPRPCAAWASRRPAVSARAAAGAVRAAADSSAVSRQTKPWNGATVRAVSAPPSATARAHRRCPRG